MLEVTIVNILAVLMAFYGCWQNRRQPLLIPCLLLAIFFSLRYNYTMDYSSYSRMFFYFNIYDNIDYAPQYRSVEIGWKILNRLCRPMGFQFLVALTTFFQFGTFYWFVNRFVRKKWRWIMLFFYVVDPWYMLLGLSAMRQTVAMSLIMLSFPSILKKKVLTAGLFWLLAFSFHKSAIIALPFIFDGYLNPSRWKSVTVIEIVIIAVSMFAPLAIVTLVSNSIDLGGMEKYSIYLTHGKAAQLETGFGFLFRMIFVGYLLSKLRYLNRQMYIFDSIYVLNIAFVFLGLVGVYFGRLGWYFTWIGIPAILVFVEKWRVSLVGRTIFILYCVVEVWTYFRFFTDFFPSGFLHYQSILTN